MSSSVFKEYAPSKRSSFDYDGELIALGLSDDDAVDDGGAPTSAAKPAAQQDSNLVVFINKNGDVSVDQSALHDLLGMLFWAGERE